VARKTPSGVFLIWGLALRIFEKTEYSDSSGRSFFSLELFAPAETKPNNPAGRFSKTVELVFGREGIFSSRKDIFIYLLASVV